MNKSAFIKILLILTIIFGISYVVFSIYTQDSNVHDVVSDSKTIDENTNIEDKETQILSEDESKTEDKSKWEAYRVDKYGFEIIYPEELQFTGENVEEKLLFGLSNQSTGENYEFWIQNLDGKTLEKVFEEKLELTDISYFDWIRESGGAVSGEKLGDNTWTFIDGSELLLSKSHYLLKLKDIDAYLIVDIKASGNNNLSFIQNILKTLTFIN